jgi:hypothetical protein
MATMVEFAQRMLMNRPTVARTSETAILFAAKSPTRAREPRTEITRPKDVTAVESTCHEFASECLREGTMQAVVGETVKPMEPQFR